MNSKAETLIQRIGLILIILLAVLGSISQAAAQGAPFQMVEERYLEGVQMLARQEYQAAIEFFTHLINVEPEDGIAYTYRAQAFNGDGQRSAALDDLDTAISLNPDNPEIYDIRAYLFMLMGNTGRALIDFNHALELAPDYFDALVGRSAILLSVRRYEDAIDDLTTVITLYPENPWGHYLRASIYDQLGDFASALRDYEAYIDLAGSNIYSDVTARVLQLQDLAAGTPVPPTPTLVVSSESTPTPSAFTLGQQALYEERQGDFAAAVDTYTQAIALSPSNPFLYSNRSNALMQLGDLDAALADANSVIDLQPDFTIRFHRRAFVNYLRQDFAAVIEDETLVIAEYPSYPLPFLIRAAAYFNLNMLTEGCEDLAAYSLMEPQSTMPLYQDLMDRFANSCDTDS